MRHEDQIRRRQDGTVDIDFYARRAAQLRSERQRETLRAFLRKSARIARRLFAAARDGAMNGS